MKNDHACKEFIKKLIELSGLQIRVHTGKLFFLKLNQNICFGYSKEPPKHMYKLMGKEINAILGSQTILIWTFELSWKF